MPVAQHLAHLIQQARRLGKIGALVHGMGKAVRMNRLLGPQPFRQRSSSRLRRQDGEACGDVMPLYNIGICCYPTIYSTLR